jgi:hypothetical protein
MVLVILFYYWFETTCFKSKRIIYLKISKTLYFIITWCFYGSVTELVNDFLPLLGLRSNPVHIVLADLYRLFILMWYAQSFTLFVVMKSTVASYQAISWTFVLFRGASQAFTWFDFISLLPYMARFKDFNMPSRKVTLEVVLNVHVFASAVNLISSSTAFWWFICSGSEGLEHLLYPNDLSLFWL